MAQSFKLSKENALFSFLLNAGEFWEFGLPVPGRIVTFGF